MRRDDIVPYLAKEFKQLRNDVQKGSEHLFGDNVTERIASITKANKSLGGFHLARQNLMELTGLA